MRILAFRHIPFEGAGRLEDAAIARGISFDYVDLYRQGAEVPDTTSADGVVFLGGPMSANDDLPWLHREMHLIRQSHGRAQPILGICLGSQLIANAFGARVYRNPAGKEIGWFDLHLTDAGMSDPIFSGIHRTETVFHWHSDTFDLPQSAEWLAFSERCAHQAFRLGETSYGFQFHLEITPQMIIEWSSADANSGDIRGLREPIDACCNQNRVSEAAAAVFGNWLDLL